MKICLPSDGKTMDSMVYKSFGRSPYFIIVDTESLEYSVIDNDAAAAEGGAGIKSAETVVNSGAQAIITPRVGGNAAGVLMEAGMKLYKAKEGNIKEHLEMLKNGKLEMLDEIGKGHFNG